MTSTIIKLSLGAALALIIPWETQAAVCEENSVVSFIARDPAGAYVSGAKVDVYKQASDANGQPKPSSRVAGGTIDSSLGRARLTWRNSQDLSATYAIRVQSINKDNASFWYYDYEIGCGEERQISETLSGITFVLRQADGNPLKNAKISVYSQLRDSNSSLLTAADELLLSSSTGSTGIVKAYLPQGSARSLGRNLVDHYVLEVYAANQRSYLYNIAVSDGQMTTLNFYLNKFRLQLKDSAGRPAAGVKVEVFKQEVKLGNQYERGAKVSDFTIGSDGYGYDELMPGTYVLGVKGQDKEYQYFWDIVIGNSQSSSQSLSLSSSLGLTGVCLEKSNLNITLQNGAGRAAAGLKYEFYEQEFGPTGIPYAGTKIGGGTTDSYGRAKLNFAPSSSRSYTLKVWEKNAGQGEYWFFDAARFVCGYDRNIVKTVPSTGIIWRDSQGVLKKNFSFTLYAQQYDVDGQPIISDSTKVGEYKTGQSGQATVYVAPYNTYRLGQSGVYAISAKDSNGNTITFYDVAVSEGKDSVFTAQISGLSGTVLDSKNKALSGREVRLYRPSGFGLGEFLTGTKTDSSGKFRLEYPAGTYMLGVSDDLKRESVFKNVVVGSNTLNREFVLNTINFSLSATGDDAVRDATIKLYTLTGSGSVYYQDEEIANVRLNSSKTATLNLANGPYLALYSGKDKQEYGYPFYAAGGRTQNINIQLTSKYLISSGQSFKLVVPADQSSSFSGPAAGSLSASVKGRILLQVQDKGQAWYVNPVDGKRYYLGRPADAFSVMQRLGLGISNDNFSELQENPAAWRRLAGRILIKTEDKGKAYYFDPLSLDLHYLGRPQDAFNVMRQLGLGITNANLGQISSGQ